MEGAYTEEEGAHNESKGAQLYWIIFLWINCNGNNSK